MRILLGRTMCRHVAACNQNGPTGMEQMINSVRTNVDLCGEVAELALNILSLVSIAVGVVVSVITVVGQRKQMRMDRLLHISFRLMFGGWLVVALEFQLAADVVATIVSPSLERLIQLGVVAFIRTFLNYFLGK